MITEDLDLQIHKTFDHAEIAKVKSAPGTLIVTATKPFIPIENFKSIFNYIDELAANEKVSKIIFDKTKLTVFHQPSMEWYFTDWKERMYQKGCSMHRKILPNDKMFVQSVTIGREKINSQYPDKIFHQLDIKYADSVEEALKI